LNRLTSRNGVGLGVYLLGTGGLTVSEPGWSLLHVWPLEGAGLVVGELDVERGDGFREVMRLGRADDGGRDAGVAQHPGESHLGHADAALLGTAPNRVDARPPGGR